MNALIYDTEIIKCIPPISNYKYQYCEGWSDFANMGIAVIACYSAKYGYQSFFGSSLILFQELLEEMSIVIGFNSKKFDDNLLKANKIITNYDLLEEVRIAAYGSPRWQDQPRGYSYSLDAIARVNGMAKSGSGSLAPQLWQDGNKREVIDYCVNDVKITRSQLAKLQPLAECYLS